MDNRSGHRVQKVERSEPMSTQFGNGSIGPRVTTTYTIQEAIDHVGFGWFQYKVMVLTGICLSCESIAIVVLSILGSTIKCQFRMTPFEEVAISMCCLIGISLSTPIWGKMADRFGRKWVLILSTSLMLYVSILISVSPNTTWILINLFFFGASYGGTFQGLTLCSEYLPTAQRMKAMVIVLAVYAMVIVLGNVTAMLVIPTLGWRWFMVISIAPEFTFLCLAYYLPESARFMLVSGNSKKAQRLLEDIARTNGRAMPEGDLTKMDGKIQHLGKISDLFSSKMIFVSIPLATLWLCCGICYFGYAIIGATVFVTADGCHGSDITKPRTLDQQVCKLNCASLSKKDFVSLILSSIGETAGLAFAFVAMHFLSRKHSLFISSTISSTASFISIICSSRAGVTALIFVLRGSLSSMFAMLTVLNVESYPTTCRSLGVGVNIGIFKFGSLLSPAIGQLLTHYQVSLGFLVYGLVGVLGLIAACLFPMDTKHKELEDTTVLEQRLPK